MVEIWMVELWIIIFFLPLFSKFPIINMHYLYNQRKTHSVLTEQSINDEGIKPMNYVFPMFSSN